MPTSPVQGMCNEWMSNRQHSACVLLWTWLDAIKPLPLTLWTCGPWWWWGVKRHSLWDPRGPTPLPPREREHAVLSTPLNHCWWAMAGVKVTDSNCSFKSVPDRERWDWGTWLPVLTHTNNAFPLTLSCTHTYTQSSQTKISAIRLEKIFATLSWRVFMNKIYWKSIYQIIL